MPPWSGRLPAAPDVLIAVAAGLALAADVVWAVPADGPRVAALVVSAAMAGALAWRRRAPLASYAVGTAALAVQATFVYTSELYPYVNLLHIYSAALSTDRGRGRAVLAISMGGVVAYFASYDTNSRLLPLLIALVWTAAWSAGTAVARRREETARQQAAAVRSAAEDERRRIARELHDLVGHTVTVMVVQAGAARTVLERDPATARAALEALERIGRGALDELDRVLGILRGDAPEEDAVPVYEPQTGLADLGALVDGFARAGLPVSLKVDEQVADLPRSVDISAYRIVQEALTNTLKHAGATRAWVELAHTGDAVVIEVRDNGRGAAGATPGRGLTGMAERVAVFDGTLDHGSHEGGYRVRAVLPLTHHPVAHR